MRYGRLPWGITLGVAIAAGSSLLPQPSRAQEFIDTLRGGMNVVATAGMGTNNVTVITLTDVEVVSFELCRQSRPENLEPCRREVEARGMPRMEWNVDCRNLSVTSWSDSLREPVTHQIDPQSYSSRATYNSYVVYDYACGTRYSER